MTVDELQWLLAGRASWWEAAVICFGVSLAGIGAGTVVWWLIVWCRQ